MGWPRQAFNRRSKLNGVMGRAQGIGASVAAWRRWRKRDRSRQAQGTALKQPLILANLAMLGGLSAIDL